MSNGRPHRRRLTTTQSALAAVLGPLDGARVPGGCQDCNAYQTVAPVTAGVWSLTVHHDAGCPFYEALP